MMYCFSFRFGNIKKYLAKLVCSKHCYVTWTSFKCNTL